MEVRNVLAKVLPDIVYIQLVYCKHFGRFANLKSPKTFNEKLQWLKLHYRKSEQTTMVDKFLVKEYVTNAIGAKYVIPTLGVWKNAKDIDFTLLPEQFVLKWNHDSGSVIICKSKKSFDYKMAVQQLAGREKYNGYYYGREWPYKNVSPVILAEPYMEDYVGKGELTDYKLHFFSGECKAIMVGKNRFGEKGLEDDFYDPDWKHFNFSRGYSRNTSQLTEKPSQLEEMIRIGKVLAKDYPFVRIDFYIINGNVYFGEITFFPSSGFGRFHPDKWDRTFGDWIHLPLIRN